MKEIDAVNPLKQCHVAATKSATILTFKKSCSDFKKHNIILIIIIACYIKIQAIMTNIFKFRKKSKYNPVAKGLNA